MAAQIPDDVADLFAVVGRHDELARKIAAKYEGLADTLSLFIPTDTAPGPLGEVMANIQRLPSKFQGYSKEAPKLAA